MFFKEIDTNVPSIIKESVSYEFLDFRCYWPKLEKITNFKHICNEKSFKFTGPISY